MEASALIFDTVQALDSRCVGTSPVGQVHYFDVDVRHVVEGRELARAVIRAQMTDSAIVAAQTPVEVYVARHVEWVAATFENDGRKFKNLRALLSRHGGSLPVPRPADPQDYGRPLDPA